MLVRHCLTDLRSKPLHGASILYVVVRKNLGVCEPQKRGCADARVCRMKFEIRVSELRHPMIGVVGGVIDALWPAESPIRARNPEMIVEAGEVGAASRITHLWLECVRCEFRSFSPDIVHAALMARGWDFLWNIAQNSAALW